MKLSDTTLRRAKKQQTSYKLFDGKGLYLEVTPTGSKLWRIAYRFDGKSKTLYLGAYPAISITDAREELLKTKKYLAQDIDPGQIKKEKELQERQEETTYRTTFRYVAEDWLKGYSRLVLPKQISKIERQLELYLYPAFGDIPVDELKAAKILEPALKKEQEGKVHTAHRLVSLTGQVLDHAIHLELIEYNLARNGLTKKLVPEKPQHHAAITDPKEVGELLCDIDDYRGAAVVKYFLKIIPYVFTRSGELRKSRWEEFDLADEKIWIIPKERMKVKTEDHKVPLSDQVISLLRKLYQITGQGEFLFPSIRAKTSTLSDVAPLNALRRMGYDKDTMSIHGFRSTASTCLNEFGYSKDHIEKQLAHKEEDEVRAAYNRAEYIEQRRKMLQDWADVLDRLRQEARARRAGCKKSRELRLESATSLQQ